MTSDFRVKNDVPADLRTIGTFRLKGIENITIYDYNMTMLQANIATLKAKLSFYLDRVRQGEEVLVLNRTAPVGKITAVSVFKEDFKVVPARRSPKTLQRLKGIAPRRFFDVVQGLREDRSRR